MDHSQLEVMINHVLDSNRFCVLATIEGNKPKARYMTLFHRGLRIFLPTNRQTHKVYELQENPNVHVLLGFDGKREWAEQLEVSGTVSISTDSSLKEKIWNQEFKQWFSGVADPDYVVLEINPTQVIYTSQDGKHEIWEGSMAHPV